MTAFQTEIADLAIRHAEEHWFTCHDGTRLFYRRWPAPAPRGAVILLHRGHEHGGRMAHLIDADAFAGLDVYAWEARGHGRSEGAPGAAPDFAALVRDLDGFVRHVAAADGVRIADIALVAQSVGAVIAATWVHDYAPPIRAMCLAAPAFKVKLFVPFARTGLGLLHRLRGDFTVTSYVRGAMLTRDRARAASYAEDPLVTRAIAANVLLDLYRTAERVVADARAIAVPTQVLIAGDDWVVGAAPQHRFYENLGGARKKRQVFPGLRHDLLGERGRGPVLAAIGRFLDDCFAESAPPPAPVDADRIGFTRDEADRLASPLAPGSLSALGWGALRAAIRLGGRLSRGMAIGRRAGFDSGAMLDHVYRNRAEGAGAVGRLVDRLFLDQIGWRGIRQRRLHLEGLITLALGRLSRSGMPARIVDIAAGHGRYVLEAIVAAETRPDSILLRDCVAENIAAGGALIERLGLGAIARFECADAFDGDGLAALDPRPTLAIVSGLYELFPENGPVAASLDGLARAVPVGGLLIYTGQPWHPQLAMIARTLTSHRGGRPWVMRRRSQAETDALVARAGFRKIEQRIDRWGIFTVSLAERVAP